jgi:sugar fermentation stimulation protein A
MLGAWASRHGPKGVLRLQSPSPGPISGRKLQYDSPLVFGRFVRRYKRFFADVALADGTTVVAHCANSGSMKTCLVPNGGVWLSRQNSPKRKLKYTWEIAETADAKIMVHPVLANALVREGIENGTIRELGGYDEIVAEPPVGEHTRFDLLLRRGRSHCYVEVKNVTLCLGAGRTSFPDAVSVRASKHLRELVRMKQEDHTAALVFCVSRTDAQSVEPAADIDPTYATTLQWAVERGVQVLAYRTDIAVDSEGATVRLTTPIPVQFSGS